MHLYTHTYVDQRATCRLALSRPFNPMPTSEMHMLKLLISSCRLPPPPPLIVSYLMYHILGQHAACTDRRHVRKRLSLFPLLSSVDDTSSLHGGRKERHWHQLFQIIGRMVYSRSKDRTGPGRAGPANQIHLPSTVIYDILLVIVNNNTDDDDDDDEGRAPDTVRAFHASTCQTCCCCAN